jgi:hypothetical protein
MIIFCVQNLQVTVLINLISPDTTSKIRAVAMLAIAGAYIHTHIHTQTHMKQSSKLCKLILVKG